MKTNKLFKISFFITLAIFSYSCNNEDERSLPSAGEKFGIMVPMEFYFSNNDGADLVNLYRPEILPFVYLDDPYLYDEPGEEDTLRYSYNLSECFNGSMPPWSNFVIYRENKKRYAWLTDVYGKTDYFEMQTFVHISATDIDTLSAEFSFSTDGSQGSSVNINNNYFVNIDKLYYNGVLIMDNKNQSQEFIPEAVFITKWNGETEIAFE